MSIGTAKVAISIPNEIFRLVERRRRALKMTRSHAVVEALKTWLKKYQEEVIIKQYIEGYKKHPESEAESKAWTQLAAQAFSKEPW